jgi:hypothetical protein
MLSGLQNFDALYLELATVHLNWRCSNRILVDCISAFSPSAPLGASCHEVAWLVSFLWISFQL